MYKCLSCGKEVELNSNKSSKVICPFCGYRILRKQRSQIIKRIRSR